MSEKGVKSSIGDAIRKNQGKLRYDLIEPNALKDMVKVLTIGADKYYDWNWFKGFSWSSVLASLKRHIDAFERGEDYDQESGELHIAHAACNVHYLNAFYYMFPQGDDRIKPSGYRRYGLDIDSVLSDFVTYFFKYNNINGELPIHWNDPRIINNWKHIENDERFWLTIPQLIKSEDIIYEPNCYITSRSINDEWTQRWLDSNLYPKAKLYTVGMGESKVNAAKDASIEVFLDDSIDNYYDLNNNGIDCYLYTAQHNKKYDVGHKRINSIHDFFKKITKYKIPNENDC